MPKKIGLALGGGGARGLAHIGVMRVLQRENIPIHLITGCSIGAIVGGLFAIYGDADKVEHFFRDWIAQPVFKELDLQIFNAQDRDKPHRNLTDYLNNLKMYFSLLKAVNAPAIYSEELVAQIFESYPNASIESLPVHFATIATDLISGREIILNEGDLRKAVMASASIPGVFPPVKIDEMLLIDGSATDSIPVQIVKGQGAQYVFAVNVSKCVENDSPLENGLQIIYRAEDIVTYHLTQERLAGADLVISPDIHHFSWAAINNIDEIIAAGEKAGKEALPRIRQILK